MTGMPRQVKTNAIASFSRFVLLFTLSRRGISWLSTKVTRSFCQVKLEFSVVNVLSISEKALLLAKTSRIAVFRGKSNNDIPLLLVNLKESWYRLSLVFPWNHSPRSEERRV